MNARTENFKPIRFSTDKLPERDRVPAWRDFFGPSVFRTEIEPAPGTRFYSDVTVRQLPGLCLVSTVTSPARFARTAALASDGNDDISLFVNLSGGVVFQRGREITCRAGDAFMMNAAEAGTFVSSASVVRVHCFHIHAPRITIAPLLANTDDAVLRRIPPSSESLRYLMNYVRFMQRDDATLTNPDVARTAALHLRDLLVLVIGASPDAAMIANGRGLRAARLRGIMDYITRNAHNRSLTVGEVAARYGISARYVQRLFEADGTTFSQFLLDRRLARASNILAHPANACQSISAIALEAGFGDISYFNRRFRSRFGVSPTQFRCAREES